jgi:predicted NodU family carbamoyl transferase
MNSNLLISLGHNSSCILVENHKVVCGYEEERFSRIKSDSSFPKKSIKECIGHMSQELGHIYISHWFEDPHVLPDNKWCDLEYLHDMRDHFRCQISHVDLMTTHHVAHAWSSIAFAQQYESVTGFDVIVADGFGNNREVFSHYKYQDGRLKGLNKITGYRNSLGLLYQYATDYCGMKMNQDEYKFLGYESKISDLTYKKSDLEGFIEYKVESNFPDQSKFEDLEKVRIEHYFIMFDEFMTFLKSDHDEYNTRIFIGHCIQLYIEKFFKLYIKRHKIKKVLLSGGLFYNVKLNNVIMSLVDKISVMPIAGDQGAALGLYMHEHGELDLGNFCWGIRKGYVNTLYPNDQYRIIEDILNNSIINLVKGNMEFGPRALGNTSTLCLPTQENVDRINAANSRNTIMPMAPIMTEEKFNELFGFREISKIIGSHHFMIMTFIYNSTPKTELMGVAHEVPLRGLYSGRAQVIDKDHSLFNIVKECGGVLINTSYNIHGQPIVYDDVSTNNNGFRTYLIKDKVEVING